MNNNYIPNHLIFEYILPKLPVKSLLRFKSVSKSWLSTISSPQFAKSHLQSSSSSSSPLQFILLAGPDHLLTYYDENNHYDLRHFVELEFEDGYDSPVKSFHILGSCNGLVCIHVQLQLRSNEGDAFFIGNPATRRFQKIMIPEGLRLQSIDCFVFFYELLTDDYKILGLFSSFGTGFHFYVFSLSTGYWVRFGVLDNIVQPYDFVEQEVVLIDKTIYISVEHEEEDPFVVGFDLVTEQIKLLPWTKYWVNKYSNVGLSELRGCLLLLCRRYHFTAANYVDDVWMLKDPNNMNSWEKLFSINLSNVLHYGFYDNGKCFVHTEEKFMVFDPTRETPQMAQGGIAFDYDTIIQSKSYVESLVSPCR